MSTLAEIAEHGPVKELTEDTSEPLDIEEAKRVAREAAQNDDSAPAVLGSGSSPSQVRIGGRASTGP